MGSEMCIRDRQRLYVASASLEQYYGALKTAQDEYDAAIMAKKTKMENHKKIEQ